MNAVADNDKRTIAFASDHAGFKLKETLMDKTRKDGFSVIDLGVKNTDRADYPDYAAKMTNLLEKHSDIRGVLICGSGIGMSMAANRYPHIRAALCRSAEEAKLARQHNDANILCLGERITDAKTAAACLTIFLGTAFEAGRHAERVKKLSAGTEGNHCHTITTCTG